MNASAPKPSLTMTVSLLLALTALFFTSEVLLVWPFALAVLWTHFSSWRYPRDANAAWLVRLLFYGGIFAFFGGKPGIGADWIFDAKTFNTIGLIAASEAVLQAWREPPVGLRFNPLLVLQSSIIFLAACNTFDDRYIRYFAPLFVASTLLAMGEMRVKESRAKHASPLQLRRVFVLLLVVASGAALHIGIEQNKRKVEIWALRLVRRKFFEHAGISNQPQLSSTFNMLGSNKRVLRIEGELNDGHLRAAAFDEYSGGRWSPTLDSRAKDSFPEAMPEANNTAHKARITKLADIDKLILAPLNSVAVVPAEGSSFEWDKTLGPIHCDDPAPYTYEIQWSDAGSELGVPLHQGVLCVSPTPAQRKRLLTVTPEVDPRVHQLARRVIARASDPAEKIEAIAQYLVTHHKYSRTTRRGRTDPVSSFLLQKKSAHCEYFASAAVILMRCAGIPARYATGYLAHERDGDVTVVRTRDAHAWVETYLDGVGWITVDATPGDGQPDALPKVPWWQRTWEKVQDEFAKLRERLSGLSRAQLFGFIVFVIIVWLFERWRVARRKKQAGERQEYSTPEELARLAHRFEKVLQKHRITLPGGKPWSEYIDARDAPTEYFAFLAAYNAARFGGQCNEEAVRSLQQILNSLEKRNGHAKLNAIGNGTKHSRAQRQDGS